MSGVSANFEEKRKPRVLIVDDDRVSRDLLAEVLVRGGYETDVAGSAEEALARLRQEKFPLVLSDIRMLQLTGLDLLREVKTLAPKAVVVLMTGFGSAEGALEAIREGAFDYLSKPFQMDELKQVLARASKHYEALLSSDHFSPTGAGSAAGPGLLGRSSKIVEVYKLMARASLSSSSVLITGEPGTGKALVAQTIHRQSARSAAPLLTLTQEDWESPEAEERLRAARGGTIVIEDLAALSSSAQARLVRAIEWSEREGIDLRWIALSRKSYPVLTPSGPLREDLLYRLSVVVLDIPPLRDRKEDLPEMVSVYIAKYNDRNGKQVSHVSNAALKRLQDYSWPGNVRELERVIERAVTLTSTSILDAEDFKDLPGDRGEARIESGVAVSGVGVGASGGASGGSLEEMERQHIVRVLEQLAYNKSKAAEALGIDRATLYRKAKLYQIDLKGGARK